MKTFIEWVNSNIVTVFRGTGPEGVKYLRPSEDGVYGPGIYFYDNLESAKAFAEPNGGVVVAKVDLNNPQIQVKEKRVNVVGTNLLLRKERIIIVPDASLIQIQKIIPTEET